MESRTPNKKSIDAGSLERRIAANVIGQTIDFNEWILQKIHLVPGMNILELCCGTGSQAIRFIGKTKGRGHYIGIDKSQEALAAIREKVPPQTGVTLIHGDMDRLKSALKKRNLQHLRFDLIFCSYGLYYSSDAVHLLSEMESLLKENGQMVIVGPYGPNNEPLIRFLKRARVDLPKDINRTFMHRVVIPWGTLHFNSLSIRTMINSIIWTSPDQVLDFWESSAYFDPNRITKVQTLLRSHFSSEEDFTNKKYVMMVVMKNE